MKQPRLGRAGAGSVLRIRGPVPTCQRRSRALMPRAWSFRAVPVPVLETRTPQARARDGRDDKHRSEKRKTVW